MGKNKSFLLMFFVICVMGGYAFNDYVRKELNDDEKVEAQEVVEESAAVSNEGQESVRNLDLLDVKMVADADDVMLKRESYTVSFNQQTRCPNYVGWVIDERRLEKNVPRSDYFMEDTQVAEKHRIIHSDYSRSGYDRGHMCPAADNRYAQVAMDECFLMTNMCPQTHTLNSGDWNDLEEKCRKWAEVYDCVYVVCGPIYTSANPKKIGQRKRFKIAVPDQFFKVVLLQNDGEYQALAYVMNNNDDKRPLEDYAVLVDDVEQITGMDFFHALPDDVENRVEAANN